MGLSEKIERLNEKLSETNPLLRHVDSEHWARNSVLLKDDDLAGYLTAAQRDPREVPLLNIGTNTLPFVRGIPEKVVTVGQLATYFMAPDEVIFELAMFSGYQLDRAKDQLRQLEARRREWEEISERIGPLTVRFRGAEFESTLADSARLGAIPFDVLYAEYLYRGKDLGKALEALRGAEEAARERKKIDRVLALAEPVSEELADAYRELCAEGFRARTGRWLSGMEADEAVFEPGEERVFLQMFLTDPKGPRSRWEFSDEEIGRIRAGYETIKESGRLPAAEFRELLRMSAQGTWPKELNTLVFRRLTEEPGEESVFTT